MLLNITFKDGKGHCNIDLSQFFMGANNSQLKTLFEMVKEDHANINNHIGNIRNYIYNTMDYYTETEHVKKYFEKDIKKLISKANTFCKFFGLPEMEFLKIDKHETVKFKKIFVYTMVSDTSKENNRKISCYPGYRFEKFGMTFHVYGKKAGRKTYYNVIVPSIGLAIGNDNCTNKQAVADLITQDLIDVIKNQCKKNYVDWYNTFIETAKNSDYPQVLDMDDYKPIKEYYIKPETETATNTTLPAKKADNNTVTENKPETAIESAYNDIDIDVLHNKFKEVYNYLYDNNNCYPDYDYYTCMDEFDNNFSKYKSIATMLSEKRHDYITSDRETVAFIIALDIISKKPDKKIFKPSKWNLSKRYKTVTSILNHAVLKATYTTITGNTTNNTNKAAYKAYNPIGVYDPITYTGNGYNIPNKPYNSIKTSAIEYMGIWNNSILYYDSS